MSGMDSAQARIDRIAAFEAERTALEDAGVLQLTVAQDAAVRAHHTALKASLQGEHELDTDAASRRLSLGLRIASLIGLVLAAGAARWGLWPGRELDRSAQTFREVLQRVSELPEGEVEEVVQNLIAAGLVDQALCVPHLAVGDAVAHDR